MFRLIPHVALGLLVLSAIARADDPVAPPKDLLLLQQHMQRLIDQAEPSIACLLVSRSDAYERLGQGPAADNPGKLGAFDGIAFEKHANVQALNPKERAKLKRKLDLADPSQVPESFGSAIVIDEKGLLLTNYHVVRDATKIFVRLPDQPGSYADILAADPRSDLAVLKLLTVKRPLKPLDFGEGTKVERGQFVLALAQPFAAGFRDGKVSASWGIVSNVRRRAPHTQREEERNRTLHHYGTLILTDARLNLGCSGGALLDLKGNVIGLTTSLAGITGGETAGGFAIPLDIGMRRIIDVLKKGEEVEYGYLGVGADPRGEQGQGVTIDHVTPGSPADRAGLQPGHQILAVNGAAVHDSDDLFLALATHMAGSSVQLDVRKPDGPPREKVTAALAKFHVAGVKIATEKGLRPYFRGLRVDYSSVLVQQPPYQVRRIPAGVLVSEVQPNSSAATALLKPGEIVTHVNNRPVNTPAEFYQEVRGRTGPVEFTLAGDNRGQPPPKVVIN